MKTTAIRSDSGYKSELDDLLVRLERDDLSTLELRVLLRLSDHEATCSELAEGLAHEPGAVGHASRSLSMRGLVRRRFDWRGTSEFVFDVTPAGLLRLESLVRAVRPPDPTMCGER